MLLLIGLPLISHAAESVTSGLAPAITDDQHYNRAIHIMAMLLVGFGFLMVFVRKYGRSALTATFGQHFHTSLYADKQQGYWNT